MSSDEADTYKCYARNEFGKAVCTVMLNIIEGKIYFKILNNTLSVFNVNIIVLIPYFFIYSWI